LELDLDSAPEASAVLEVQLAPSGSLAAQFDDLAYGMVTVSMTSPVELVLPPEPANLFPSRESARAYCLLTVVPMPPADC